jgi:hypothetical protein
MFNKLSVNSWSAPSDYGCEKTIFIKEKKVLSSEEWHKKIESNKIKYRQGRRFVAEPE